MQASLSCKRLDITSVACTGATLYLQILDLTFCVKSPFSSLLDDVAHLLQSFHCKPLSSVTHTIEIREDSGSSSRNRRVPQTMQIRVNGRIRNREFPTAELTPYLEWLVNRLVVRAYRGRDRYCLVHAAVVVKNRQGVLICGKSGSGKSSLVLTLVSRHGYRYLTDEFACWDAHLERIVAYPKAIMLKEFGYQKFQQKHPQLLTEIWDSKSYAVSSPQIMMRKLWYFNPTLHMASKIGKTATIRHVVFPTYDERTKTRIATIPMARALVQLQKQRLDATTGFCQRDFEKLGTLMNDASASKICYQDVFEAAEEIHAMVRKAA